MEALARPAISDCHQHQWKVAECHKGGEQGTGDRLQDNRVDRLLPANHWRPICDLAVIVPSDRTSRVQEAHITIGHIWCEMVDAMVNEIMSGLH